MSAEPLSEEELAEIERHLERPVSLVFAAASGLIGRIIATVRARDEEIAKLRDVLHSADPKLCEVATERDAAQDDLRRQRVRGHSPEGT